MTSANITMDGTSAPSTVDTVCHRNEPITFFYNASKKPLTNEWTSELKLVMGLGIIVSIFTVMANMLVMVAIYRNRRFHFPIYYLMANLAAADFLAGLSYFYLAFNTGPETKNLTVNVWMFRQGLIDTSLTASVANLLAIAIERHITVFQMQLHSKMSVRRVVIIIAIIWIAAIFMGAIPGMGWNCICDIKSCSTMVPLYSTSYLTFWAVSNLFVFFVMLALYTHIFAYVRGRAARMAMHGAHLSLNSGHATMGLLKTVSIVLGAFIVCWTPGMVILLLDVYCQACDVLYYEKYFLVLAMANSAMNPIIYSSRDKEMRATLQRLLCCCRFKRFNEAWGRVISSSVGDTAVDAKLNSQKRPFLTPLSKNLTQLDEAHSIV
uniref:lysophosphatidic acid receptor 1-like isoform X1 n=2 Tax=Myxine glutinosa TaxID=7769 RepID=UPI00358DE3F9